MARPAGRSIGLAILAGISAIPATLAQSPVGPREGPDLTPETDTYRERTAEPGHAMPRTGPGPAFSFSFTALDENGDNVLTRDEVQRDPLLQEVFGDVDINGDLQLSPAEFAAFERLKLQRERQGQGAQGRNAPGPQGRGDPGAAGHLPQRGGGGGVR